MDKNGSGSAVHAAENEVGDGLRKDKPKDKAEGKSLMNSIAKNVKERSKPKANEIASASKTPSREMAKLSLIPSSMQKTNKSQNIGALPRTTAQDSVFSQGVAALGSNQYAVGHQFAGQGHPVSGQSVPSNRVTPALGNVQSAVMLDIQSQHTSSSQSDVFKSCQDQVNFWHYMTIEIKDLRRGALLGRGAYAEVYKGQALGTECAIKVYRSTASEKQLKEAMHEIRLGASLDHPCTLRILGWVQNPLQMITELCCGDLKAFYSDKIEGFQYSEFDALRLLRVSLSLIFNFLRASALPRLSLKLYDRCDHIFVTQESASGILYLHTVGIIHRDIKPGNILIGIKAKTAKVADYGISREAVEDATMTMKGTPLYQAPEVSRGERYGFAADVYSYALTMYEVCTRVGRYFEYLQI